MYIYGYYYNQKASRIDVRILTQDDRTSELEIQPEEDEACDIFWTDSPVETESEVNDTFDHLLMQQATISMNCRQWVRDFFCQSCREAIVNILVDGEPVFYGYIEPMAYSQPYNEVYDEVELTCVDCLSALQYSYYRNIGQYGIDYATIREAADQRSFLDIILEMMRPMVETNDIEGTRTPHLWYDGSKALDSDGSHRYTLLEDLSIDELLFLDEDEDSVWTQQDVLKEILQYLNLHLRQEGTDFYLYDWQTARTGKSATWHDLLGNATEDITITPQTIDIRTEIAADCDTEIELAETYNQLVLTDSVTEVETVVESPLDSDSIKPLFPGKQIYLREYTSWGMGSRAYQGFAELIGQDKTSYDAGNMTDWFLWAKTNTNWHFYVYQYLGGGDPVREELDKVFALKTNQHDVAAYFLKQGMGAAIIATGKLDRGRDGADKVTTNVDLKDGLVLSMNGLLGPWTLGGPDQTPSNDQISKSMPLAEYAGNVAGGNLSPADEDTIHYIVVQGKVELVSNVGTVSGSYKELKAAVIPPSQGGWGWPGHKPTDTNYVPRTVNSEKYYALRWYGAEDWKDAPTDLPDPYNSDNSYAVRPVMPTVDSLVQTWQVDECIDLTSNQSTGRMPVLMCMLVVGDKCVVEKRPGEDLGTGVPGTGKGLPDDYVWMDYKEREDCASNEEWAAQSFAVCVEPDSGQTITGKEMEIKKNAEYQLGITAEGTAIPIHYSDKVHGQVRFYILGPYNLTWADNRVYYVLRSVAGGTSDGKADRILPSLQSIVVKDFKVEIMSDNGRVGEVDDDADIVYMSDTKETYVNRKDDIIFKLTTALTADECAAMGVNNAVKLSSPYNTHTGDALITIYDRHTGETAKPEQLYVDAYWREWHDPKVTMTQNFDGMEYAHFLNLYRHPAMEGRTFHAVGIDRNLTEGTATMKIKEI